jgi:membrane protein YdbS with pleckstrin-like domain
VKILAARWRAITFELKEKEIKETSTFLGFAEKTLQYKNIKQVELKQGLVQRALDIGDVVVTTQATAQHADIQLFNLKEYKEVYEFLLAKLNENQSA